jgi:hypothetical protein
MFIILFAHIPTNPWADWIPARFGFSDATEIFVFCSGLASALAFGRVFDKAGLALGTARIAHRVWQVYWAHIGVFVAIFATLAFADSAIEGARYLRHDLNLGPFLDEPTRLAGFMSLTYVPNYFDILPMYLVILALIPFVMGVERIGGRVAVLSLTCGLWLIAAFGLLDLPAETWGQGRPWFFNPFSWQLVFFLGFAFARGWLRAPPVDRRLVGVAIVVLVVAAPFSCQYGWSCHAAYGAVPWLGEMHGALGTLINKTHLGVLRVVHFAALAYVAYAVAGPRGMRLRGVPGVSLMSLVGRQTLAVFLAGLWLAQALGVALDIVGRNPTTVTLANIGGCALLVLAAALTEWFKAGPWSAKRPRPAGEPDSRGVSSSLPAVPTAR